MKPEAGQWWVAERATAGDTAEAIAVRIEHILPNGDIVVETYPGKFFVWKDANAWHHEPRCTGWDWVVPKQHPQPAEDPDEAMALLKQKQCSVGCHGPRCPNPALPGKDHCGECADWSYHNQQKPQPKKTMLRLWVDSDCNIHAGLKNDRDLELLYDHETRQFYTEEQP